MKNYLQYLIQRVGNSRKVENFDRDEAWNKVLGRCKTPTKHLNLRIFSAYAASALILFTAGGALFSYLFHDENSSESQDIFLRYKSKQVELIMANGDKIDVDHVNQYYAKELSVTLSRDSVSGQLAYKNLDTKDTIVDIAYNRLVVPKGSEFSFVLSDGSTVKLNSESILEFPVQFSADSRIVYLQGEAYFDVKHNEKIPFKVITGEREVVVLGTTFNVSAYPNEGQWSATLLSGRVSVTVGEDVYILHPSEQCLIDNETNQATVKTVDTDMITSWMNGRYYIKNCKFEDVVEKMHRLYDFEMHYAEEDIKAMKFRGMLDKNYSLEETLHLFEKTGVILFEIDGNKVTVRKKMEL